MKQNKTIKILIIALSLILVGLLVWIGVLIASDAFPLEPNETEPPETTAGPTAPSEPIRDLGEGIYLMDLFNVTGTFVEDGNNAKVDRVAAIMIENRSDKTLQLADIFVIKDGVQYSFRMTTLPAGAVAVVQESGKQVFGKTEGEFVGSIENVVFFKEEPSLYAQTFQLSTGMNLIEITNKTDSDIAGPIYIYYKSKASYGYQGGITYRVQVPSLKAGETYDAYAGHFYGENSQVMFIDYPK